MDMHVAHNETQAAAAFGVSLQVACGETAQVVLQTHMEREATDTQRNATIDLLYAAGERLSARYRVASLRRQIDAQHRNIQFTREQFARAEEDHITGSARRASEIDATNENAQRSWESSGKRGDMKPDPRAASRISTLRSDQEKADDLRRQTLASHDVTIQKLEEDIRAWQNEIDHLEAVLHGADG